MAVSLIAREGHRGIDAPFDRCIAIAPPPRRLSDTVKLHPLTELLWYTYGHAQKISKLVQ